MGTTLKRKNSQVHLRYSDAKPESGSIAERSITLRAGAVDQDNRTVELAFSTETGVERWYGTEILSHEAGAMRADRLNDGAAVLLNHDSDQHVGVVESARVDKDKVGRAVVRLSRSELGEQTMQEIMDGIKTKVSVGYLIHQIEEKQEKGGAVTLRITDWEPLEVSLVAVPADGNAGVGRSIEAIEKDEDMKDDPTVAERDTDPATLDGDAGTKNNDVSAEELRALVEEDKAEKARAREVADMRQMAKDHDLVDATEALIKIEGTAADVRKLARDKILNANPSPIETRHVYVSGGAPRYRKMHAFRNIGEEAAYRMGQWSRAVIWGDQRSQKWCNEHGVRAMSEGVFTAGGALVPDEMSQAIIDLREEFGIARQLARVMPMASDVLVVPRRTGGTTAYFVGENTEPTASDKGWDQVQLSAKKLGAQTKFSSELAEDSVIDVAEDVAREHAYAFAEKEDDCYFNGDGTSTYGGIYGLRAKIIDGTHTAGAVDGASAIDTFAEVTQAELDSLMAVLPQYALMGAQWVCSQPAKALVFDSIAAAAGGTTMTMLGDRPQASHLGYPIQVSQKMPTSTGDLSNLAMLAFGNFESASMLGDRRGFTMRLLSERYAELDQLAVVAFERFDIVWHDLGDNTTAGPVVALIGE
ncbi:MAG TPA: phage major capsid protein [Hyphomicrobiaceae bacterium]|nr:phage major capsid protein [Hyphomicrobiaceae bacterium]